MFCNNCGCQVEVNERYCRNCGARILQRREAGKQEVSPELIKGVQLLKNGDERGFSILYSHTCSYVCSRARYLLHDADEAQDLVQEVYLAAYRNIGSLKKDESIYGWLGGITYRLGMKIIEKKKKMTLLSEEAEGVFESLPDERGQPGEEFVRRQDAEAIQQCIGRLSEEQRAVILAYYFDNLKTEEIAQLFGISEGTVKSRLYLARKNLRKYIAQQEERQGYTFRSSGVAALILALRLMLEDNAAFSVEWAKALYRSICQKLGIWTGIFQLPEGKEQSFSFKTSSSGASSPQDSGKKKRSVNSRYSRKRGKRAMLTAAKVGLCVMGMAGAIAVGIAIATSVLKAPPAPVQPETTDMTTQIPEVTERATVTATPPSFEERNYELTDDQKGHLMWEMQYASHYVTCPVDNWIVEMDELSDKAIVWLAMDVVKRLGNTVLSDMTDGQNGGMEIDAGSFLEYLKGTFGRELTCEEVSALLGTGLSWEEGSATIHWDGNAHGSKVDYMIFPIITDARQVSEDTVVITGKYAADESPIEEETNTFESEWKINADSKTDGLQLRTLKLNVDIENTVYHSWTFEDDMEAMCRAVIESDSSASSYGMSGTPGDIDEDRMGVLVEYLLLRDNILGKEIHGEFKMEPEYELPYAVFTKDELEDFFANTIGCGFTDTAKSAFQTGGNEEYIHYYQPYAYDDGQLQYLGDGSILEDGSVEYSGRFSFGSEETDVVIRVRQNEKSFFEGYTVESIAVSPTVVVHNADEAIQKVAEHTSRYSRSRPISWQVERYEDGIYYVTEYAETDVGGYLGKAESGEYLVYEDGTVVGEPQAFVGILNDQ